MKIKHLSAFLLTILILVSTGFITTYSNSTIMKIQAIKNSKIYSNGIELLWGQNALKVSTITGFQRNPTICPDGSGGAIIAWRDNRSGDSDIYAQRINSSGSLLWVDNGTPICIETNYQSSPDICSDEAGGAIITWVDYRGGSDYDIYAQKINSSGDIEWTPNGTVICNISGNQYDPKICYDGKGGAIITWYDNRYGESDIYAQLIASNGTTYWGNGSVGDKNGTVICNAINDQSVSKICSDGENGAIITWMDFRYDQYDVYAQRVDENGTISWGNGSLGDKNGTVICNASDMQMYPEICSDVAGGAIITWEDHRNDYGDIYVQHIISSGVTEWNDNGIAICTKNNKQIIPKICSDGAGGAIITWHDWRVDDGDIYTQRVNSLGIVQWRADGSVICNKNGQQAYPQIASCGTNGTIIAWQDNRTGDPDVYAQKIDLNGKIYWPAGGAGICTMNGIQGHYPGPQIYIDENGEGIIVWSDDRGADRDLYAQKTKTIPVSEDDLGILFLIALEIQKPKFLDQFILPILGGIGLVVIVIVIVTIKKKK